MDYRNRVITRILSLDSANQATIDWNEFVKAIILYDSFVLESIQLKEFTILSEKMGVTPIIDLIKTGIMEIQAESVSIGEASQLQNPKKSDDLFNCVVIRNADHKDFISKSLESVRNLKLEKRESQYLRKTIADAVKPIPPDLYLDSIREFATTIRDQPNFLREPIRLAARELLKIEIEDHDLSVESEVTENNWFRIQFNYRDRKFLTTKEVRAIITEAILGSTRLNTKFADMNRHKAMPSICSDDIAALNRKFEYLVSHHQPQIQKKRFQRFERMFEFPDVHKEVISGRFNFDDLLALRNSDECQEFRKWLPTIDSKSDNELKELFCSINARIAQKVGSKMGKIVRFVGSTALGFSGDVCGIPGPMIGLLAGGIDNFVIDQVFPRPGHLVFINEQYPSLFNKN